MITDVLKKSCLLYWRHGFSWTIPVILPVVLMVVSLYFCLDCYRLILLIPALKELSSSPVSFLGVYLTCIGLSLAVLVSQTWQYICRSVAVGLNAFSELKRQPCKPEDAFSQIKGKPEALLTRWFTIEMLVSVALIAPHSFCWLGFGALPDTIKPLLIIALLVTTLFDALFYCLFRLCGSYVLPLIAINPYQQNSVIAIFKKSAKLSFQQPLLLVGLSVFLCMFPGWLIPELIVKLTHLTGLAEWFNLYHHLILSGKFHDILLKLNHLEWLSYEPFLMSTISDLVVSSVVSLLLMPFGILVFSVALYYLLQAHIPEPDHLSPTTDSKG